MMLFCVGCDWDGGDCCGVKGYKFCKECKCKDCNYKPEGDDCIGEIKGKCNKPSWKGDKNCDDDNNNAGCAWGKISTDNTAHACILLVFNITQFNFISHMPIM